MAEDDDKSGQDATIQVSGSELEALRQSAQLGALKRDGTQAAREDHDDAPTLAFELYGDDERSEAKEDDSTKSINRQSLVQIIKTEINASNQGREIQQFGIMRRDDRATPSLKKAKRQIIPAPDEDLSDPTQAIGKEELKMLRLSQHTGINPFSEVSEISEISETSEVFQDTLTDYTPEPSQKLAQPLDEVHVERLDETMLLAQPELDEHRELSDATSLSSPIEPTDLIERIEAPQPVTQPPPDERDASSGAPVQDTPPERTRTPLYLFFVVTLLFIVGAILLIGLDALSL